MLIGPHFKFTYIKLHPVSLSLHCIVFIGVFYLFEQYDFQQDFRKRAAIFKCALTVLIGGILVNFLSYILAQPNQSRRVFVIYCVLIFIGVTFVRIAYSFIGSVGAYDKKTLIFGSGKKADDIVKTIKENKNIGIKILQHIESTAENLDISSNDTIYTFQSQMLRDKVVKLNLQILIVAISRIQMEPYIQDLTWCAQEGIEIWDTPTAYERLENKIPIHAVDDIWLLYAALSRPKVFTRKLKRLFDVVFSSAGILFTLPIMFIAGLAIYIESRGPIILRQKRIGQNGNIFILYKFRSMYQNFPTSGEKGTSLNDKRVTKVGRFIRRTHIDELPQLINVLRGELSLVGPRAELSDFVHEYIGNNKYTKGTICEKAPLLPFSKTDLMGKDVEYLYATSSEKMQIIPYIEQRFTVPQGITGWAQVKRPYVSSSYEDMMAKLAYDLYYIKNMSILLDIIILLKTIKIVLFGKGK